MGLQLIKPDTKIDFMSKRKMAALISGAVILLGLVGIVYQGGLKYGIDFAGGINVQVQFDRDIDVGELNSVLEGTGLPDLRAQRFGQSGKHQYLLRIPSGAQGPEEVRGTIQKRLSQGLEADYTIQRLEMVGPKVGEDLRNKAMQALFYAVLLISIYISGRFEQKWGIAGVMAGGLLAGVYVLQLIGLPVGYLALAALLITVGMCWYLRLNYALGAVVALVHDIVITVCILTLLGKDFELSTVAALLTIMGYSLNDTIVNFDRIREILRSKNPGPLGEVINRSINQMLSRTLLTSGTTLLVVLSLVILGGGVIHNFALALLIGVIVGTYSSIYIAGSLLLGIGPTPETEETEESAGPKKSEA
ncbi:MAG: protein translocase subunit SecF [Desulfohalobiaceae bacterium]|nr:protein translocase subunit SecF [Desulfohalobiaceae bacterium]MCF8086165.1 protein translocase subunit SecF [Desulfohalobiaceae bacterium]